METKNASVVPHRASSMQRWPPIGAEVRENGTMFRVWAPEAHSVKVVLEADVLEADPATREVPLEAQAEGYFAALIGDAEPGMRYHLRIDEQAPLPDPASRFQPEGVHGPSLIVDPRAFVWSDHDWRGVEATGQVLYEMHVGTFTQDGTWKAAGEALPALAELGITVIELMPIAEFPGAFGWGYDGVDLYAPFHRYGRPDEMRRFVDAAHRLGLGVILDVVYNHLGPEGNYLPAFSPYWIGRRKSDWGDAPNFDGPHSAPVRQFYAANGAYWIDEYHLDGLRLDATQQIFDESREHILGEIVRNARAAAGARSIYVIAENEAQDTKLVTPAGLGGIGCDGIWNDDFHHAASVALCGRREAYYSDYTGAAQEIVSAVKRGFLFQGQRSAWQRKPRGSPALHVPAHAFVHYLENHDQVANSVRGELLSTLAAPARLRAMTALLLLSPQTPLIFQGQEYASLRPFLYFADHIRPLADAVREGRADFLAQFPSMADAAVRSELHDPADAAAFRACQLDPAERATPRGVSMLELVGDLLALRKRDAVMNGAGRVGIDGAVLGAETFVLRYFARAPELDRLLIVNLGSDLLQRTIAEPLLAPPAGARWQLGWSSEDPRYGGCGHYAFDPAQGWRLTAGSAVLLAADDTAADEKESARDD